MNRKCTFAKNVELFLEVQGSTTLNSLLDPDLLSGQIILIYAGY